MQENKPKKSARPPLFGEHFVGRQNQAGQWTVYDVNTGKPVRENLPGMKATLVEMALLDQMRVSDGLNPSLLDCMAHRVFQRELVSMTPEQYTDFCEGRVFEFAAHEKFMAL